MYIKTIILGRIGKDAVTRQTQNGDNVISFNVAVDLGTKENPKTLWVTCSYWRKSNESTAIAQYLKSGTLVLVEGQPGARAWQGQDGGLNANLELTVYTVKLAGGGSKEQTTQTAPAQTTQAAPAQATAARPLAPSGAVPPHPDDLPF